MKTVLITGSIALFYSIVAVADVVVIVNPNNNNTLNKTSISQIFLGKTNAFSDGSQAIPINQKEDTPLSKEFTRKALKKSTNQLRAYWSKLMFTGKGTPPKVVQGDSEVIKLVLDNPNLIGYVSKSADTSNVKVVEKF